MILLLKKVTIIDPKSKHHHQEVDILFENNKIIKIGKRITDKDAKIIEGKNHFISSAWIDVFADLKYPGGEEKESPSAAIQAAKNNGFGHIIIAPNNQPPTVNAASVTFLHKFLNSLDQNINCHIIGAVTQHLDGNNLSEMIDMNNAGAIAFSDGWSPIQRDLVLQQALQYSKSFNGTIIQIPINEDLNQYGIMNEGNTSTLNGINSMPAYAEDSFVQRQIQVCKYTGGKLHISGISTANALEQIKQAKKDKLNITCSVTPYHLLFNDEVLSDYDSLYKVLPALRSERDRKALVAGLEEGYIDCIASHHRPQNWDDKVKELSYAKWGMASMDVIWPMLLLAAPKITPENWIKILSENPSQIFNIQQNTIQEGGKGSWTIFNLDEEYIFTENNKKSIAYNVPLLGQKIKGKAAVI